MTKEATDITNALLELLTLQRENLKRVKRKFRLNEDSINSHYKNRADELRHLKLHQARRKTTEASNHFLTAIRTVKKLDISKINDLILEQHLIAAGLNGKVSVTEYQKTMSLLAISIGYNMYEIARLLGITNKHMRTNIYDGQPNKNLLKRLEWFDRCPNPKCGIKLSEYFEILVRNYKTIRREAIEKYGVEPLLVSDYQRMFAAESMKNARLLGKIRQYVASVGVGNVPKYIAEL